VNDYDDELNSTAQKRNQLLLRDNGMDDDSDDRFIRNSNTGGGGLRPQPMMTRRYGEPLIEEEKKVSEPPAKSQFTDRNKANLARNIYAQDFRTRYQKFDDSLQAKSQATKNVKEMFGGKSGDTLGFGKLFGEKSNWRSKEKAQRAELSETSEAEYKPAKGMFGAMKRFWWRLKNRGLANDNTSNRVGFRQAAIGPKMSWMQRLFGARRDPSRFANSAKGMGIKNPKEQGWADQLINASKEGRLDEPGDNKDPFISNQPLVAQAQEQRQNDETYDSDASSEEENQGIGQKNENVDNNNVDNNTEDDNSSDSDDDSLRDLLWNQAFTKIKFNESDKDEDSEDEDD
jgi:hypothetical protein